MILWMVMSLCDKMFQIYQQLFIVYKVYKGSEVYSAELMRVLRGSWQSSGSIPCGWLEDAWEQETWAEWRQVDICRDTLPSTHRAARAQLQFRNI